MFRSYWGQFLFFIIFFLIQTLFIRFWMLDLIPLSFPRGLFHQHVSCDLQRELIPSPVHFDKFR